MRHNLPRLSRVRQLNAALVSIALVESTPNQCLRHCRVALETLVQYVKREFIEIPINGGVNADISTVIKIALDILYHKFHNLLSIYR